MHDVDRRLEVTKHRQHARHSPHRRHQPDGSEAEQRQDRHDAIDSTPLYLHQDDRQRDEPDSHRLDEEPRQLMGHRDGIKGVPESCCADSVRLDEQFVSTQNLDLFEAAETLVHPLDHSFEMLLLGLALSLQCPLNARNHHPTGAGGQCQHAHRDDGIDDHQSADNHRDHHRLGDQQQQRHEDVMARRVHFVGHVLEQFGRVPLEVKRVGFVQVRSQEAF